ncbi:hypothetical protein RhiirA1_480441 [Rhizophagus irregularis]|uniref:Uncharacterized protein n=1 Tax=Rhizophagus irregularis TaxID=588596 RepID=A0A2N0QPC1_9GLOM|nr:hypothetical protein RhiirA1_480441 [Rhizophagus irregularis]
MMDKAIILVVSPAMAIPLPPWLYNRIIKKKSANIPKTIEATAFPFVCTGGC